MSRIAIPDDILPWLRDFASSSPDADLADFALAAADRIEALEAENARLVALRDLMQTAVSNLSMHCVGHKDRADALSAALLEIITDATSLNHARDIARDARKEAGE